MAFPAVAGWPAYSGNIIPELWSGKIVENFYNTTVLAQIANTDYEGEIKKYGDTVNIRTTPTLTIRSYQKGATLISEMPDSPKIQLLIDQGDYFYAVEDDVDKIQSDVNQLDRWAADAAEGMKVKIDTAVLSGILPDIAAANKGATAGAVSASFNLGTALAPVTLDKNGAVNTSVVEFIIDTGTVLDEANVPPDGRWMVIPAKMAGLIKKSDLRDASISGDPTSIMRNGRIGMIDRFTLYVSHNLNVTTGVYDVIAGHKRGITFATQMTQMGDIALETTFGRAIRGLQVYGYKVIKPEALAQCVVTF